MLTQDKIEAFYRDLANLKLKFPVAELHRKTNESKGNISRILNRLIEPSESFIEKFYKGFKIVPRGTDSQPAENKNPPNQLGSGERVITKDDYISQLEQRVEDFRKLIVPSLNALSENVKLSLAFQRAWVDHFSEIEATGKNDKVDYQKKEVLIHEMHKLVRAKMDLDPKTDILAETGK